MHENRMSHHLVSGIATRLAICLAWGVASFAANRCVGTVDAGITCDTTAAISVANIQAAMDAANPGDTIYVQPGVHVGTLIFRRAASGANPITVTSGKPTWLPCANCRITPSYRSLIPIIRTESGNTPALNAFYQGSPTNPPSGWKFVGIGFETNTVAQFDNAIVATGGQGYTGDPLGWTFSGPSEMPDSLTFDRVYVGGKLDDSIVVQNGIRFSGTNGVFKNSYLGPIYCGGIECHALAIYTSTGPVTITNNFISATSIPLMSGGGDPDYYDFTNGVNPSNVTVKYTHLYRPLKWWPIGISGGVPCNTPGTGGCVATLNPKPNWYIANGHKFGCTKNLGEFKTVNGALLEFNVHENIWVDYACQGQWFAWSATPRLNEWTPLTGYGPASDFGSLTTTSGSANFSFTRNGIATSFPQLYTMQAGQSICQVDESASPDFWDCHKVATVDLGSPACTGTGGTPCTITGTVVGTFSITGTKTFWVWASNPTVTNNNITIRNSVWRNAYGGFNILGRDRGTYLSSGSFGRVVNFKLSNLLVYNNIANWKGGFGSFKIANAEINANDSTGGGPITIDRVTFDNAAGSDPGLAWNMEGFEAGNGVLLPEPRPLISGFALKNSILPSTPERGGGDTNHYALFPTNGLGSLNNWQSVVEGYATGTRTVSYNWQPYVSFSGCTTATCTGNKTGVSDVSYLPGTRKIVPGSALHKAGSDGGDIGVNPDTLPEIRNLRVTSSATTALLEFDLSGPIQDAGNSQPCALEVAPSESLISYVAPSNALPYTTINDLNPAYFRQAGESNRTNGLLLPVIVSGGHVSWPLGQQATAIGDDGISHSLALVPDINYYGRLMCYGDTQHFTFRTKPTASGATFMTLRFTPPAGTTDVVVNYGETSSLVLAVTGPVVNGKALVNIPVIAGVPVYHRYTYVGHGYQSPIRISLQ